MKTKTLMVTGFLLALLIAGVASFYASSQPDGLEFVAEKTGFLDRAQESPTAESPFADYATEGVDNKRLSSGLAGLVGVGVVAVAAGGLFWGIRRRTPSDELV
jgi:cobalt/nickel transport protein